MEFDGLTKNAKNKAQSPYPFRSHRHSCMWIRSCLPYGGFDYERASDTSYRDAKARHQYAHTPESGTETSDQIANRRTDGSYSNGSSTANRAAASNRTTTSSESAADARTCSDA